MTPVYGAKLGLKVQKTDIGIQKVDDSTFDTFGMVLVDFKVEDKLGKTQFFQEIFLIANITLKVIFGMLFLTLSNANVQFVEKEFTWRFYSITETLPTTK